MCALPDAQHVVVALNETTTAGDVVELWTVFNGGEEPRFAAADIGLPPADFGSHARRGAFLTQPVFHAHRSETAMMRYLKALESRDLSLTHSMIPLGSCTMKLNAAAELMPISWRGFAGLHPFAPLATAQGYQRLFAQLEQWLADITGLAAVSLQPNSGSQGEYAGLLAIRAYQRGRGEGERDACLIPVSAHGTNPASAAMAGLRVIAVACDGNGNVDLADLAQKIAAHRERLCCLMVTYPSTHGVFEPGIVSAITQVHEAGGQVYMDGANMNAQVGLTSPGLIGADVCHLNLHKTFAIPHGGGGPGMGPICVARHLAPFLPKHGVVPVGGFGTAPGPVSAAPWGSASILPIPWMYIRMMGRDGLTSASATAILSANWIAHRLGGDYPVLYRGAKGLIAHECILDLRPLAAQTGIGAEDVAKRLMDYGFHAPDPVLPGRRHPDDRADRKRAVRRAGALLRGHAGDPRRDPRRRRGPCRSSGQSAEERSAHQQRAVRRWLDACLWPRAGGVPAAVCARTQILAERRAHRQYVGRSQPDLHLPERRGDRGALGLRPARPRYRVTSAVRRGGRRAASGDPNSTARRRDAAPPPTAARRGRGSTSPERRMRRTSSAAAR